MVTCLAASLSRQDRAVFQNSEKVNTAAEVRGISPGSHAESHWKQIAFLPQFLYGGWGWGWGGGGVKHRWITTTEGLNKDKF